jgi:hypothetical protein
VPHLGEFWGHDDRYRGAGLKNFGDRGGFRGRFMGRLGTLGTLLKEASLEKRMFPPTVQGANITILRVFGFVFPAEEGLVEDLLARVRQEATSETNPTARTRKNLMTLRIRMVTRPTPSRTDGVMMDMTK